MNLRLFTFALLTSTLPIVASAGAREVSLNRGDFISAKPISKNGETVVSLKLSKSGKAKFRKLNQQQVDKKVHAEIAGVESNFVLREPIRGNSLEMGPYSQEDAEKVVEAINKN